MEDRFPEFLGDISQLVTNEKCKAILKIVEEIEDMVSYMDWNDWNEFSESEEYQEYIEEYADRLNEII